MMEEIVLKAEPRTVIGKQNRALRREGRLPAVLYGRHIEPTPISLDMHTASMILPTITSSQFITIELGKEKHSVLVRERQKHPVRNDLVHVDFQAVSMTETVRAQVAIHIVGDHDIPAVENYGAIINTGLDVLEIECLPQDLPERIEVELTGLVDIGDSILVKDLTLPQGVVALDDPEALVVVVSAPISEEEPEEEEILEDGAEPEVIEKGYGEEED